MPGNDFLEENSSALSAHPTSAGGERDGVDRAVSSRPALGAEVLVHTSAPSRDVNACYAAVVHRCVTGREEAMKERRVRCKQCGERFTVLRFERERTSAYCDLCREERKRQQARDRMRALRARLTKHIHRCRPH